MQKGKLLEKVRDLPSNPGVYIFKNGIGEILYVGKAKNLKARVGSYFRSNLALDTKTYQLVQQINDIDFIEVFSELDALILEAELIKKHDPKYNIVLKDDKSYLYIAIRPEKVEMDDRKVVIPRILPLRKPGIKKEDIVFGPYPNASTVRYIVKTIRKFFPFRDCSESKFKRYQRLKRQCLFGQLNLCPAPCVKNIKLSEYKNIIRRIKAFLSGDSSAFITNLTRGMLKASQAKSYEKAAEYRDLIKKFEYVRQVFRSPQQYMNNPYLVEDVAEMALDNLVEKLPILKGVPRRIECYDISDISGKEAVGSMVVALDGRVEKGEYKRFKITMKEEPDDVGMMQEVLSRRLKKVGGNSWPKPDLIILDGGKGHVSAVLEVLTHVELAIPVVGLAKRFETVIYKSDAGDFKEALFGKDNLGLKLFMHLRDEAHRFAQSYHHLLRLKGLKR